MVGIRVSPTPLTEQSEPNRAPVRQNRSLIGIGGLDIPPRARSVIAVLGEVAGWAEARHFVEGHRFDAGKYTRACLVASLRLANM
jgi:hypothetical protein